MSLLMALYMSYAPIKKIGKLNSKIQTATASLDRIEYILEYPDEVPEADDPVEMLAIKGDVMFEHVSFSYDDELVLKDVNLSIPSGQVVALVGPSGAGKTTFANLIPRFYDVCDGKLLVEGHDVRVVTMTVDGTTLRVRDTGTGIEPAKVANIFDPFFTTKAPGKGLGLGLSISFNIVSDFGGTLSAANHPNGGAVFSVALQPATPIEVAAQ